MIKIKFCDFWEEFNYNNNFFSGLLRNLGFEIKIVENNPDYIIYSSFGNSYKNYNCRKIFFTGENIYGCKKEFVKIGQECLRYCDYSFTFYYIRGNRHYRLPLYFLYEPQKLIKKDDFDPEKCLREKSKFCSMVVSDDRGRNRIKLFEKLSKYKKVDSGGKYMNNIGGHVAYKTEFMRDYKFHIAYENSTSNEHPGYTTEKLPHAMMANTLGIYWGNHLIHKDFNPKSFINFYDFKNEDEMIDKIIEIDNNDDLYLSYMKEYYYHNNTINKFVNRQNVRNQFAYIFNR